MKKSDYPLEREARQGPGPPRGKLSWALIPPGKLPQQTRENNDRPPCPALATLQSHEQTHGCGFGCLEPSPTLGSISVLRFSKHCGKCSVEPGFVLSPRHTLSHGMGTMIVPIA